MVQIGQVSDINGDNASCRVAMDDLETPTGEPMVSDNLQILFPAVDQWNFVYLPKAGDHVTIARLPNGESEGFVLGKPYTADNMPQGAAEGVFSMVSSDGKNVVRLNGATGKIDIIFDQKIDIKTKQFDLEIKENFTVKVNGNVNIESDGDVIVKAANATIEAKSVKITGGELETQGTVSPTGQGPYCGLPNCVFSGAPQTGSKVSGT